MPQIHVNAAAGTLSADPGTTGTTLDSAAFEFLPTIAAPDFLYITVDPTGVDGLPEIVKITAHSAAATSVTVTRYAQTQTDLLASSGRSHAIGTVWRAAATKASFDDLAALVPAGTVRWTVNTSADTGWLLFDQAVANCDTLYPALWAVAPAAWKSGSTLNLPDMADTVIAGAGATTAGATGGANTKTIAEANLPPHTHTGGAHKHVINPPDTAVTINDPGHDHDQMNGDGGVGGMLSNDIGGQPADSTYDTGTSTTGITASVNIAAFDSATDGSAETDDGGFANTALDVRSLHLALTAQIKAH